MPLNVSVLAADSAMIDQLASLLGAAGHNVTARAEMLDQKRKIGAQLEAWIADPAIDLVVGVSTEATRAALLPLITKRLLGFSDLRDIDGGKCEETIVVLVPAAGITRDALDTILARVASERARKPPAAGVATPPPAARTRSEPTQPPIPGQAAAASKSALIPGVKTPPMMPRMRPPAPPAAASATKPTPAPASKSDAPKPAAPAASAAVPAASREAPKLPASTAAATSEASREAPKLAASTAAATSEAAREAPKLAASTAAATSEAAREAPKLAASTAAATSEAAREASTLAASTAAATSEAPREAPKLPAPPDATKSEIVAAKADQVPASPEMAVTAGNARQAEPDLSKPPKPRFEEPGADTSDGSRATGAPLERDAAIREPSRFISKRTFWNALALVALAGAVVGAVLVLREPSTSEDKAEKPAQIEGDQRAEAVATTGSAEAEVAIHAEPTTDPATIAPATEPMTNTETGSQRPATATTAPATTPPATTAPATTAPATTAPATTTPATTTPATTTSATTSPATTTASSSTTTPTATTPTAKSSTTTATKPSTATTTKPGGPQTAPSGERCDQASCVLDDFLWPCCARFKPRPRGALPYELDRAMVTAALSKVKAAVIRCGEQHPAKGLVKLALEVGGDGRVKSASVAQAPDPALGSCVVTAVRKAVFARTEVGGSFSYPFNF